MRVDGIKTCNKCQVEKHSSKFYTSSNGCKLGIMSQCIACVKDRMNANARNRKYDKRSFLIDKHNSMQRRVDGKLKGKEHLYEGLPIMNKNEFVKLSLENEEFNKLHDAWVSGGCEHRMCPSPNRLNSDMGYLWDNIDWVTQSVNSIDGAMRRNHLI